MIVRALTRVAQLSTRLYGYRLESCLIVGSFYAGMQLLFWPDYIYLCTQAHKHLSAFVTFRLSGFGISIAAILTAAGLFYRWRARYILLSVHLRAWAFALHFFFWTVAGISLALDSIHTPTVGLMLGIGLLALLGVNQLSFERAVNV